VPDHEIEKLKELWRKAFKYWNSLLEEDAFWNLLSIRISVLDDPRLSSVEAQSIKANLPFFLSLINCRLSVTAALEGNYFKAIRQDNLLQSSGFDAEVINRARFTAVQPLRLKIKAVSDSLIRDAESDLIGARQVIDELVSSNNLKNSLTAVDILLPAGHATRVSLHDQLAERVRSLIVSYGVKTERWEEVRELISKSNWMPESPAEEKRHTEELKKSEERISSDFRWRIEGYFDLPPGILNVLEKANEDIRFDQWDKAINQIESLFTRFPGEIGPVEEQIIYKPLSFCYSMRGINQYYAAFEVFSKPAATLVQAAQQIRDYPNFFFSDGICSACGDGIRGKYFTYEYEGIPIIFCNQCGRKFNREQDQKRRSFSSDVRSAARDLILAEALDPENQTIKDKVKRIRDDFRQADISMPKRPELPRGKKRPKKKENKKVEKVSGLSAEKKPQREELEEGQDTLRRSDRIVIAWSLLGICILIIVGLVRNAYFTPDNKSTSESSSDQSSSFNLNVNPTATSRPRPTRTPVPTRASRSFREDFNSENGVNWGIGTSEQGTITIEDGKYIYDLQVDTRIASTNGLSVEDGTLSLESFHLMGEAGTTGSVILFRATEDRGYVLVVYGDGSFLLYRDSLTDNDLMVSKQYHEAVHNYWHQPNRWEITMDGPEFKIICNGVQVAEFRDSLYSSGKIYLGGFSDAASRVKVGFDNVSFEDQ
jgi:hypothetical protein